MTISFTIPGKVTPKERPRFSVSKAGVKVHTAKKTTNYENVVGLFGRQAMRGKKPLQGPVFCRLSVKVKVPQSWSKKKQESAIAGEIHPTGRPDIDNLAKSIFDALNGICWLDDAQIVSVEMSKTYATADSAELEIYEKVM